MHFFNPIQAGVFWNHIDWEPLSPLRFSFVCGPITTKLAMMILWDENPSKAIEILLTSSLGGNYDVIKPFLVFFQVKIRVPLSFVQLS